MLNRLILSLMVVTGLFSLGCAGQSVGSGTPGPRGLQGLSRVRLEVQAFAPVGDRWAPIMMRDPARADSMRAFLAEQLPELRLDGGPGDPLLTITDTCGMQPLSRGSNAMPDAILACRVRVVRPVVVDGRREQLILYDQETPTSQGGDARGALRGFVRDWRLAQQPPAPRMVFHHIGPSPSGIPVVIWDPWYRDGREFAGWLDEGEPVPMEDAGLTETEEKLLLTQVPKDQKPWFFCFRSSRVASAGPKVVYLYLRPTLGQGRAVSGAVMEIGWHFTANGLTWEVGVINNRNYSLILPPATSVAEHAPAAPWLPLELDGVQDRDAVAIADFLRTSPAIPDQPGRRVDGRLPVFRIAWIPGESDRSRCRVWMADGQVLELRQVGAEVTLLRSGIDISIAPQQE